MDGQIKDMLGEEIKNQLGMISGMENGSEEKYKATSDLERLYKLWIEENNSDRELDIKKNQATDPMSDRKFKIIMTAVEIGVPIIFYSIWMAIGMNFEKTGKLLSDVFKGFRTTMKPTKLG